MNKREEDLCSLLQLLLPFVPVPAAIDATLCDSEKWFNVACAETYVDQSTQHHNIAYLSVNRETRKGYVPVSRGISSNSQQGCSIPRNHGWTQSKM